MVYKPLQNRHATTSSADSYFAFFFRSPRLLIDSRRSAASMRGVSSVSAEIAALALDITGGLGAAGVAYDHRADTAQMLKNSTRRVTAQ